MRRVATILATMTFLVAGTTTAPAAEETLDPNTQQVVTFAIRDIAHAGMLDPLGEYYSYETVYAEQDRWVVSFVASHCYANEKIETCDPYQGRRDHLDPDAWLEIVVDHDEFQVSDAFGRISEEQEQRLKDYAEPFELEDAHVFFPTVRIDPSLADEGYDIRAAGMWAGVLPDGDRVWSLCRIEALDDEGTVVWTYRSRIAEGSRGETFRSGWLVGVEGLQADNPSSARMTCEVFSGETWRATADPTVTKIGPRKVTVSAPMKWLLGGLVSNLSSRCDVELLDADGDSMKSAAARGPLSPWTGSARHQDFNAALRVGHASRVASATLYCHEA